MRIIKLLVVFPALALGVLPLTAAEHVTVAAAANLVYVLEPLNAAFAKVMPECEVRCEVGASGSLVAQIENGAPYDVFLSADTDYPKKLANAGAADPKSMKVFARGRLVLWTFSPALELSGVGPAVSSAMVKKLAIANPDTAPYGRAAKEALEHLGLTVLATPKLVFGENVSQTAQYVSSGNADAGFVALSLVLSPKLKDKGRWIEVPTAIYTPILQAGILTNRGGPNPGARKYLEFLLGAEAQDIFARYGYGAP